MIACYRNSLTNYREAQGMAKSVIANAVLSATRESW